MNAVTWQQIEISDESEEVGASIAPSTISTYRRTMVPLEIWLDWHTLNNNVSDFA